MSLPSGRIDRMVARFRELLERSEPTTMGRSAEMVALVDELCVIVAVASVHRVASTTRPNGFEGAACLDHLDALAKWLVGPDLNKQLTSPVLRLISQKLEEIGEVAYREYRTPKSPPATDQES